MLMTILILALNLGISWANCRAVGSIWQEAKHLGGWLRVLTWCGAVQAAIGFSSVIGAAAGYVLYANGYLPPPAARAAASLWYLIVVLPAIGTGLIITVYSWIVAFRTKRMLDVGVAAYNTFAQGMNMYDALSGGISDALSSFGDLVKGEKKDDGGAIALFVILLVAFAVAGGAILAAVLIQHYSRRQALPVHVFGGKHA